MNMYMHYMYAIVCIDDLLLWFFCQTTQATSVTKTTIMTIIITTPIGTAM